MSNQPENSETPQSSDPTSAKTPEPEKDQSAIAKTLLDTLVCPLTKETLSYNRETNELISKSAKLAYPILNGIPVMIPSEARDISAEI